MAGSDDGSWLGSRPGDSVSVTRQDSEGERTMSGNAETRLTLNLYSTQRMHLAPDDGSGRNTRHASSTRWPVSASLSAALSSFQRPERPEPRPTGAIRVVAQDSDCRFPAATSVHTHDRPDSSVPRPPHPTIRRSTQPTTPDVIPGPWTRLAARRSHRFPGGRFRVTSFPCGACLTFIRARVHVDHGRCRACTPPARSALCTGF